MSTKAVMPLTSDQYDLVLFCEQMYLMTGRLPDESTATAAGHSAKIFSACIKLPLFNLSLSQRGIRPYNELDSSGNVSQQLSSEQLHAANTILDQTDNRSRKKKLTDLHISTQKWETWLRDPAFQRYLSVRGEAVLGDHGYDAHLALVGRVQAGDVNAIKYYNEITGRFVPAKDKGVDVQTVLLRVMEIVQRRINSVEVQMQIADDLIALSRETSGQYQGVPLVGQLRPQGERVFEIEAEMPEYKPRPVTPADQLKEADL